MSSIPIILASESPTRLELLKRIKILPDKICPANIDESELKGESPENLVTRLAFQKAIFIADKVDNSVIIAADTAAVAGRKILPKALSEGDVAFCLRKLSGRRHRVYTGLCIIKKLEGKLHISKKLARTIVKFKVLTPKDIEFYCRLGEGMNKAGGYSIAGYAESFVSFLSGSHSNIMGLPLLETANILNSMGIIKGNCQI
jgi:septum formation protein